MYKMSGELDYKIRSGPNVFSISKKFAKRFNPLHYSPHSPPHFKANPTNFCHSHRATPPKRRQKILDELRKLCRGSGCSKRMISTTFCIWL